jgi:hypothetical protein
MISTGRGVGVPGFLGEETEKTDQGNGTTIARVGDWMVVIMAPHLQLLPLCAWGGKLSAKQWSVISDQWSVESRSKCHFLGGPVVGDSGKAREWAPGNKVFLQDGLGAAMGDWRQSSDGRRSCAACRLESTAAYPD